MILFSFPTLLQRQLLDELMGKDRNSDLSKENRKFGRQMTDDDVCKMHLAGLCPFTLFSNTKWDLGSCGFRWHDDALQAQFAALPKEERDAYGWEHDLLKTLRDLVRDVDRVVEKGKERVEMENAPKELTPLDKERLEDLDAQALEAEAKATALGEAGDVDGSEAAMREYERLKLLRAEEETRMTGGARGRLDVCEISGVFMNSADGETRKKDHLRGKQYQGWKSIREKCAALEDQLIGRDRGSRGEVVGKGGVVGGGGRDYRDRDRDRDERLVDGGEYRDRGGGRDHRGRGGGRDRRGDYHHRGGRDRSRSPPSRHGRRDRDRNGGHRGGDRGGDRGGSAWAWGREDPSRRSVARGDDYALPASGVGDARRRGSSRDLPVFSREEDAATGWNRIERR